MRNTWFSFTLICSYIELVTIHCVWNTCLLLSANEFPWAHSPCNLLLPRLPQIEGAIFLPLKSFTIIHGIVYTSFTLSPTHSMDFTLVFHVLQTAVWCSMNNKSQKSCSPLPAGPWSRAAFNWLQVSRHKEEKEGTLSMVWLFICHDQTGGWQGGIRNTTHTSSQRLSPGGWSGQSSAQPR